MPYQAPNHWHLLDGGRMEPPHGSVSASAVERCELDRVTRVPPGVLDLITRDLTAKPAAEAVLLVLRDRQSVLLLSSADGETAVDTAALEGRGFVGRALQSGRAAVEPVEAANSALLAAETGACG